MYTKPLVQPSVVTSDFLKDMASINRMLAAAAISSQFRARLLTDPGRALRVGFAGEHFPLSQSTREHLISIQATTLPDFVRKLDEKLSYRLHVSKHTLTCTNLYASKYQRAIDRFTVK